MTPFKSFLLLLVLLSGCWAQEGTTEGMLLGNTETTDISTESLANDTATLPTTLLVPVSSASENPTEVETTETNQSTQTPLGDPPSEELMPLNPSVNPPSEESVPSNSSSNPVPRETPGTESGSTNTTIGSNSTTNSGLLNNQSADLVVTQAATTAMAHPETSAVETGTTGQHPPVSSVTTSTGTTPAAELLTSSTDAISAEADSTMVEKRSTTSWTSTSSSPLQHLCVTSMPCADPNSHCVNMAGINSCQCRSGYYRLSGRCTLIEATTSSSFIITSTDMTTESSNGIPAKPISENVSVRLASELTPEEKADVVSIALQPTSSVIQWILERDVVFRRAIAEILSAANVSVNDYEEAVNNVSVTAGDIQYVAPSPQLIHPDTVLVSFLVRDAQGLSLGHSHQSGGSSGGIIARHRRNIETTAATGYFPSLWVISALRNSQNLFEKSLNQTVTSLFGGEIPSELNSVDAYTATSLFERRLDVFIPVILIATLCSVGLVVGLVCHRSKKRSTAKWDPPAEVIYVKNTMKREDPLGSTTRRESSLAAGGIGHHLATDEQCRDGEEQLMNKHSIQHISADDDAWIVPYEEGSTSGRQGSSQRLNSKFEDTKL